MLAVRRLRYSEFRVALATGNCRAALGWTAGGGCPYAALDGAELVPTRKDSPLDRNHRDPLAVLLFAIGNRSA